MFSKYSSSNEELSSENLIVLFLILVPLWMLIAVFVDDIIDQIKEKKVITIECKLLNRNTGVSRYGEQHDFTTFNCGDYGVLTSDNEKIFRKAKENNKLNVYFGKHYYKIFSIKE